MCRQHLVAFAQVRTGKLPFPCDSLPNISICPTAYESGLFLCPEDMDSLALIAGQYLPASATY